MPIYKIWMPYRCVSSLMHFQWIIGRFLLLDLLQIELLWVLKSRKACPERGSGARYTPYSVAVTSLGGSDNVTVVCWVLQSQNSLVWYPAFKFHIKMFQSLENADIFCQHWKSHIPMESHTLVGDGRIPTFNALLRALPISAKSGNTIFKNLITLIEEENKSRCIFAIENRILSWAAEP